MEYLTGNNCIVSVFVFCFCFRLQNFPNESLTQEEENWLRFAYLLVDEGTKWVCKILKDYLANMTLTSFLKYNKKSLEALTKRRPNTKDKTKDKSTNCPPVFYEEQFASLFPEDNSEPVIEELDLTLLITLILQLKSSKHEDKRPGLVRMRQMRNDAYGHIVKCKMSNEEFKIQWSELTKILEGFGAKIEKLDEIKDREVTAEKRAEYAERITTLFSSDLEESTRFANEKKKQIAQNHALEQKSVCTDTGDSTRIADIETDTRDLQPISEVSTMTLVHADKDYNDYWYNIRSFSYHHAECNCKHCVCECSDEMCRYQREEWSSLLHQESFKEWRDEHWRYDSHHHGNCSCGHCRCHCPFCVWLIEHKELLSWHQQEKEQQWERQEELERIQERERRRKWFEDHKYICTCIHCICNGGSSSRWEYCSSHIFYCPSHGRENCSSCWRENCSSCWRKIPRAIPVTQNYRNDTETGIWSSVKGLFSNRY